MLMTVFTKFFASTTNLASSSRRSVEPDHTSGAYTFSVFPVDNGNDSENDD
jgi:hypothetical protein